VKLDTDYFRLFDLPRQFLLDKKQLKKRSRELLRQYHPDKYTQASAQEQRLAVQFSAHINTAVATLSNPVSRAQHLLKLEGAAGDEANQTVNDADFLLQQMELRESIESASQREDVAALEALQLQIEKQYNEVQLEFSESTERAIRQSAVAKMQFYDKLQSEIAALLKR